MNDTLTTIGAFFSIFFGIYFAECKRRRAKPPDRLTSAETRMILARAAQRQLPSALPPVLRGVAGSAGGLQVGQAVVVARGDVVGLGSSAGAARQPYAAPPAVALKHGRAQPLPASGKAGGAGGVVPVHFGAPPAFQAFSACPDGHLGVHPLRRASQSQLQRTCFWDGCGKTWYELI